jgi:hypothetical protein
MLPRIYRDIGRCLTGCFLLVGDGRRVGVEQDVDRHGDDGASGDIAGASRAAPVSGIGSSAPGGGAREERRGFV